MADNRLPPGVEAVYPLSPTQQGMLYHTLQMPGGGMYLGQHVIELQRGPDIATSLASAWREVLSRHAALRSSFAWRGLSKSVQIVHSEPPESTLLQHLTLDASELEAWLREDAARDFDLTNAPPTRTALITVGRDAADARSLLVWTRHHLLVDGWSAQLVLGELAAAVSGGSSSAPVAGFGSYIAWLQRRDATADLAHWRELLANWEPQSALAPVANARPASGATRRIERRLDADATSALRELAQRAGVTLASLVHGAWGAVLGSLSGADEVGFGSTLAGRPVDLPDAERIVGSFIHTLPVRLQAPVEQTVANWFGELQRQLARAATHGHLAQRDLIEAAGLSAGASLFDSIVVFMNYPQRESGTLIAQDRYDEHSHYPLAVLASASDDCQLIVIHDRGSVSDAAADLLLSELVDRLSTLVAMQPEDAASGWFTAPLRNAARPAQTPLSQPPRLPLAMLLDGADKHADAPAIADGSATLNYRTLATMAATQATMLHAVGVQPGDAVLLVAERSARAIASLWGILWAGAVYVPIAPESTPARLQQIADGCGAVAVITAQPVPLELPQLPLAEPAAINEPAASALPPASVDATSPAYVIHTSGSTGLPKPIAVSHGALAHSVAARLQFYGTIAPRYGLCSPLSFDSSVAGIFWAAATGGELVIVDEATLLEPPRFVEYIRHTGIDTLLTLPRVHAALLDAATLDDAESLPSLRRVIVAGEACPRGLLDAHRWVLPNASLCNEYGPTEATVWCAALDVAADDEPEHKAATLPIGQAIPGATLVIENRRGQPLPVGVTGELIVAGPTVAAPNRPDGCYATGDLARLLPGGDIEFCGRLDDQLKIRGQRVEPGEIEAELRTHPDVADCAVRLLTEGVGAPERIAAALAELPRSRALELLALVEAEGSNADEVRRA